MSGTITVFEQYETLREEIIQPDKTTYETRYFLLKWEPTLGANAARIVRVLRSLGYHNRVTKQVRDGIPIDLPELAKMCGFSVPTLKREFANNIHLHKFVQREKNYKRDSVTGQVWREENIYRVKMVDPLHPDDEETMTELMLKREKGASGRMAQSEPYGIETINNRMAHFDSIASQSDSNMSQVESIASQSDSITSQNEPSLKSLTLNSLNTLVNTLNYTAIADSEVFASLSQDAEQKEPEAKPLPLWAFRKARSEMSKEWFIRQYGRASNEADWEARAWELVAEAKEKETAG